MKRPVLLKETIKEERMEVVSLVERHPKYKIEAQKSKVSRIEKKIWQSNKLLTSTPKTSNSAK